MLFIDQVHDFRSTEMRNHGNIPVPNGFEDDKLTAFHQTKCMLYGTMCIMANGQQDVVYTKTVVEYNNILQGLINRFIIQDHFKNIIYYQLPKTLGDYSQIFSSIHKTLGLDSSKWRAI